MPQSVHHPGHAAAGACVHQPDWMLTQRPAQPPLHAPSPWPHCSVRSASPSPSFPVPKQHFAYWLPIAVLLAYCYPLLQLPIVTAYCSCLLLLRSPMMLLLPMLLHFYSHCSFLWWMHLPVAIAVAFCCCVQP